MTLDDRDIVPEKSVPSGVVDACRAPGPADLPDDPEGTSRYGASPWHRLWGGAVDALRSVVVVWSDDPLRACHELLTEELDLAWPLPDVGVGDVVVTVARTEPPLVLGADRVAEVLDDAVVLDTPLRPDGPVVWDDVALHAQAFDAYTTTTVQGADAARLLAAVIGMLYAPTEVQVPVQGCRPGEPSPQDLAVAVTAVLAGHWGEAGRCACCDRRLDPRRLEVHSFGAAPQVAPGATEPLLARAERTSLLCSECHRACHEPMLADLRRWREPSCPDCGGRRTVRIELDEETGPSLLASGSPQAPQWWCEDCGALYGTYALPPDDEVDGDPSGGGWSDDGWSGLDGAGGVAPG